MVDLVKDKVVGALKGSGTGALHRLKTGEKPTTSLSEDVLNLWNPGIPIGKSIAHNSKQLAAAENSHDQAYYGAALVWDLVDAATMVIGAAKGASAAGKSKPGAIVSAKSVGSALDRVGAKLFPNASSLGEALENRGRAFAGGTVAPTAPSQLGAGGKPTGTLPTKILSTGTGGTSGGGGRVVSRYADNTPVLDNQKPARLSMDPDPAAVGPHSRLRIDQVNGDRVYQAREFDAAGHPVRDIDFTSPTYPNSGLMRKDHLPPPHQHRFVVNDPRVGPRSGFKRLSGEPDK